MSHTLSEESDVVIPWTALASSQSKNINHGFMIGSPFVELPKVVPEDPVEPLTLVVLGSAVVGDVVGTVEAPVVPVVDPKVVADKPVVDSNVDPVEPIVVGKVVEDGLVENWSVVFLSTAVVLNGSDKIEERLLTLKT